MEETRIFEYDTETGKISNGKEWIYPPLMLQKLLSSGARLIVFKEKKKVKMNGADLFPHTEL